MNRNNRNTSFFFFILNILIFHTKLSEETKKQEYTTKTLTQMKNHIDLANSQEQIFINNLQQKKKKESESSNKLLLQIEHNKEESTIK